MLFLLGGNKKEAKPRTDMPENMDQIREVFLSGRFPVVTTEDIEDKKMGKVLGLVVARAYDAEDAFFGMTARAINKGAQAIVGYKENVAFHPDGTKYFSCYGTAVQFERPKRQVPRMA